LEVDLDVALPQDKLQQMNMAAMAKREGIASVRWIQEKLLNIAQSEDMQQEVWTERALDAMFNVWMQGQLQKMQQAQMQQMQPAQPPPQQPPGMGAPGPMAATAPGGLPPGGIPPTPGLQGLPPEMAMMGGQGPEIPPEMMGEQGGNPLEMMMQGGA
jgi:hypothetical protein